MFGRRGGGVTVQPILFHFGAVTSFSPIIPPPGPPSGGGPIGRGGGGPGYAALLLPLAGLFLLPILVARGPSVPPAAGPTPPAVAALPPAAGVPGPSAPAAPGTAPGTPVQPTGPAAPPGTPAQPTGPVAPPGVLVSPVGPSPTGVTPAPKATPPLRRLPFTGEDLWIPFAWGLGLVGAGILLRRLTRLSRRTALRPDRRGFTKLRPLSAACLCAGAVLLAWPAYQVVSTGVRVNEVQTRALAEWDLAWHSERSVTVADGLVLAIPTLHVRLFVPEGATLEHLKRYGVGRISWTALPDADGMLGIAGHRTTYGAPFFRLNALHKGDAIAVEYHGRRYTYRAYRQETVRPWQADALEQDHSGRSIALVTCSPPYSATFRLIVFGRLENVTALASPRSVRGLAQGHAGTITH